MLTREAALVLLEKYRVDSARIRHSRAVAAFAHTLASKIHDRHPLLDIDPEKVMIAALLHDIGRAEPGDHELNTIRILQNEALGDIAAVTMHGSMYEIMKLRGVDDPSLLPVTLENKIVAYADARVRYKPVTLQERIEEIMSRRGDDDEKVMALRIAAPRYKKLERELLDLAGVRSV